MINKHQLVGIGAVVAVALVIAVLIFNYASQGGQGTIFKQATQSKQSSQKLQDLGFFLFNQPRQLAPVKLSRLAGEQVSLAEASDNWQLVNFGYLFCPDICPINLRLLRDIKKEWDQDASITPLSITHITFDPERDTPDRLGPYLDYLHKEFIGLTGEIEGIRQVAQQLNTVFIHEKPDEYGNYFITHSDSIAVLNPAGEYVGLFKGPYDQEKMMQALKVLINPS